MIMKNSIQRFTSILCTFLFLGSFLNPELVSQSKDGFYDEYDMNLRNLPGGAVETGESERYRIYQVPPKKKNNFVVTPKQVRRYYDPLAGIPGAGAGNLENLANEGAGRRQQLGGANQSLINPVTGELNADLTQENLLNQDQERERKEKDKKRFIEEETFKESKLRRFQIVFFLTMPFALGLTAGAAGAIGIEKAISGSILMIVGTTGLSAANAFQDLKKLDQHKDEHGTEWHEDEEDLVDLE